MTLVEISLGFLSHSLPLQGGKGTYMIGEFGWRNCVCLAQHSLSFSWLRERKQGQHLPTGPEQESALLGTMSGSICLIQRWGIHLPVPFSTVGPRVQYRHHRELLWCFCLLQPDSHVCLPMGGELFIGSPKTCSLPQTLPGFIASVR